MTIPGTTRREIPAPIDSTNTTWGRTVTRSLIADGALHAKAYLMGKCSILIGREPVGHDDPDRYRWHMSIAHPDRYPSWDEIKTARFSILELADVDLMVQLLPKVEDSDWTNFHENCFHLYEIPADSFDLRVT